MGGDWGSGLGAMEEPDQGGENRRIVGGGEDWGSVRWEGASDGGDEESDGVTESARR